MKLGADSNQHVNDSLSVYGVGLKTSAVWFSDTWSLESSVLNSTQKFTLNFDLQSLLTQKDNKTEAIEKTELKEKHYTEITLRNHIRRDDEDYYKDEVLPYLLETFYKFKFLSLELFIDNINISVNPKKLFIIPNNVLYAKEFNNKGDYKDESFEPIKWEKDIDFEFNKKRIHGYVRIMNQGKYGQPGIRLLRNNRVIEGTSATPNLPKKITGTKNKYGAQRIYGEIHLDNFVVNYQKTGFDDDLTPVYTQIESILTMSPDLRAQAENYRVNRNTKDGNDDLNPDDKNSKKENEQDSELKKKRTNTSRMEKSEKIERSLNTLKGLKLLNLYKSLCTISLKEHPVLSYVGAWSFLESLATLGDKDDGTNFKSFYKSKINQLYNGRNLKGKRNDLFIVLEDIEKRGNAAKHSGKKEEVTGTQLRNDFEVLEEFLVDYMREL